jgi:hypothetical protein
MHVSKANTAKALRIIFFRGNTFFMLISSYVIIGSLTLAVLVEGVVLIEAVVDSS